MFQVGQRVIIRDMEAVSPVYRNRKAVILEVHPILSGEWEPRYRIQLVGDVGGGMVRTHPYTEGRFLQGASLKSSFNILGFFPPKHFDPIGVDVAWLPWDEEVLT